MIDNRQNFCYQRLHDAVNVPLPSNVQHSPVELRPAQLSQASDDRPRMIVINCNLVSTEPCPASYSKATQCRVRRRPGRGTSIFVIPSTSAEFHGRVLPSSVGQCHAVPRPAEPWARNKHLRHQYFNLTQHCLVRYGIVARGCAAHTLATDELSIELVIPS